MAARTIAGERSRTAGRSLIRRRLVGRLIHDRMAVLGLLILAVFSALAIAAPLIAPHDPVAIDVASRLQGPSAGHPLGTDHLGRDVFSRLVMGSRWSLGTAGLATVLVVTIGIGVGAVAGYFGGLVDALLMRLVDVLLGFPRIILALAIVGTLGPGIQNVMIGLTALWWADYARVVRGHVLVLRERGYVRASRAIGAGPLRLLWHHVLPGVIGPVIVLATLEMGDLILTLAGLNFLGLGAQPPTPEWGAMLNQARPYLQSAPMQMIYPGVAISVVVLGFNLLGDGLRDVLDPRAR